MVKVVPLGESVLVCVVPPAFTLVVLETPFFVIRMLTLGGFAGLADLYFFGMLILSNCGATEAKFMPEQP